MLSKLILAIALVVITGATNAEPRSRSDFFLYTLLTDADPNFEAAGAKAVAHGAPSNAETFDLVAEVLSERTNHHDDSAADRDAAAWCMKALATSKSTRYRAVIDRAIAAYADEKVGKFGALAIAELTDSSAPEYSPGSVSLEKIRGELSTERATIVAGSKDFSQIAPGQELDAIFNVMGYPDEIVHARKMQLRYFGYGIVDVDNEAENGSGWRASSVWPDIPTSLEPYAGTSIDPADARQIMTSEPAALHRVATHLFSQHVTDPAVLDRLAEHVRHSMSTKNLVEMDALGLFCRLLGDSGNKRYMAVLSEAATQAEIGILKRHALAAYLRLKKSG